MTTNKFVCGDALDEVARLPGCCVDAVITDPPYAATGHASSFVTNSHTKSVPREYQFFEAWLREHLSEWRRVLKPEGAIWMSTDWRGAMSLDKASTRLGLGECFAVLTMPNWQRRLTDEQDVWDIAWHPSDRKNGHSAEKPIDLMRRACRLLCPPGSVILDPFFGTGTTGVAAVMEGMSVVGIEREQAYLDVAKSRIDTAEGVKARGGGGTSEQGGLSF